MLVQKFNGPSCFDANVTKTIVSATIDTGSINTGFKRCDAHLASPCCFNAKEIPTMTFKSTKVEKTDDKTGHSECHRQPRGGAPPGEKMFTGFTAKGTIKRSEYGLKFGLRSIGDEVEIET